MKINIIPLPNNCQVFNGQFVITADSLIFCDISLIDVAEQFNSMVSNCIGAKLKIANDETAAIRFEVDNNMSSEEYSIACSSSLLCVRASTKQGCFYAIMSLRQLLDMDCSVNTDSLSMLCLNISDKPRFSHRGLMLDVVRHFFNKEEIFRLIDLMGCMKLNVLHLHLSDDQGFRVQIDKYPEINYISSTRKGTTIKFNGTDFDNTEHKGFYTKSDVKEIVSYASTKHIKIIPEIDVPGHTVALIAAMPHLSCSGKAVEVSTKFGIHDNVLCGGNEQVFTVIEDIISEITEVFDSKLIHLGGDEVPLANWKKCPKCQAYMKENNIKNAASLQTYMFNRLNRYVNSLGWRVIGWNDCLNSKLDKSIICQHWSPNKVKRVRHTVSNINNGRQTIMSNFFKLYFDYPYAMTPLRKTYTFNPILCGVKRTKRANVLGVEAAIWTEWIDSRAKLDFNTFPRLAALAEIAWTNNKNKNYLNFCIRLRNYYSTYEAMGVGFARHKTRYKPLINRIKTAREFFKYDSHNELRANDK